MLNTLYYCMAYPGLYGISSLFQYMAGHDIDYKQNHCLLLYAQEVMTQPKILNRTIKQIKKKLYVKELN